jgi:dTDP-4-dehydrorhamnose reductase
MRFVVLGAQGQLGSDLCPLLGGDVIRLGRTDLDLANATNARSFLQDRSPDVVINCAAYNFVDRAESAPVAAFVINGLAVYHLARACAEIGCRFVHWSTDYVFGADANRDRPYQEDDPPGPVSVYGASKLAGEHLARIGNANALVIRTCGLYGLHGSGGKGGNFIETMLRLAKERKPIRVIDDQHCTPSYTVDVAAAGADLIVKGASGIVHFTNSGSCSWYQLARQVFQSAGLEPDLSPIPTSQYPTPARRPGYSVLSLDRLASFGVPEPRPWEAAVDAYLTARAQRDALLPRSGTRQSSDEP